MRSPRDRRPRKRQPSHTSHRLRGLVMRFIANEDDRRVDGHCPVIRASFQVTDPKCEALSSTETDEAGHKNHEPVFGLDGLGQCENLFECRNRTLGTALDGGTLEVARVRSEKPVVDSSLQHLSE